MNIKLRLYGEFRKTLASRQIHLTLEEGSQLGEVLDFLEHKHKAVESPPTSWDQQMGSIRILINGMDIYNREGFDTELVEGDIVTILPMIAGG
jgi:molybdopterin converting factor small subunit